MDPERFEAAGARFVAFFNELGRTFVEREELLAQVALGLLSREHVLMTGPPGTAKSGVASAVLRRVVDEKTGAPSLFARQFTESTVQTDLVGPINFKTLMETGRTEHFTDEGMLGAVHAFLDEVFDGRDMLLRSTLNVLQERELKQGSVTTRGQIECALMTTNRYLAEILEGSRETLLAFVDRIAFVCFVPRGFASVGTLSHVLKKQVGAGGGLSAALTIQDLDVLQAAAEEVEVPDGVLDALAHLLGYMEEELAAAERSDPQFLATRYLSTRTAVRLGRLLRAVCIYDRLFTNPERRLEATGADLSGLRLSLVLGGPQPAALAALLERETDARERRQLGIIRSEREIFERCIKKLPPIKPSTKKPSKESVRLTSLASEPSKLDTAKLVETTRALAQNADVALKPEVAKRLLRSAVAELGDRALRAGLITGPNEDATLEKAVTELLSLAVSVEKASAAGRPTARWLRGRALNLVEEAVTLAGSAVGQTLDHLKDAPAGLEATSPLVDRRIEALEGLVVLRNRIRALGAEERDHERSNALWHRAALRAEEDVAALFDVGFQKDVATVLAQSRGDELEGVLLALARPFDILDTYGKRLALLGGSPEKLKTLVVAPRLQPLVASAFERVQAPDRVKLVAQVERLLQILDGTGLRQVLAPRDLLAMTAEALVRSARMAPAPALTPLDRAQYRRLRKEDQRVPGAFTLLEIALRVAPGRMIEPAQPEAAAAALAELARDLPQELARSVAEVDLGRLERAVTFLERWGASLAEVSGSGEELLRAYAQSGFFHVLTDEQALLRTSLEIRLVADVFPAVAEAAERLRERVEVVEGRSHDRVKELLSKRSEEAWASMLGT